MRPIICWNEVAAPCRHVYVKGIYVNWYSLNVVPNTVFTLSFLAMGICQYRFVRSNVEMYLTCPILSSMFSIFGIENILKEEMALTFQKSMQSLIFPSALGTTTTRFLCELCDVSIILLSSITSNSFLTGLYKD